MTYDIGTLFGLFSFFLAALYLGVEIRLHLARNAKEPKRKIEVPPPPARIRKRRDGFTRQDFVPSPFREAA